MMVGIALVWNFESSIEVERNISEFRFFCELHEPSYRHEQRIEFSHVFSKPLFTTGVLEFNIYFPKQFYCITLSEHYISFYISPFDR